MQFENPIWVASKIEAGEFFKSFTQRLSQLVNKTKEGDKITVFINSSGGDTYTSLGIYDLILNSKRYTTGIVAGIAHSAASIILQACSWRIMMPHSSLMLHRSHVNVSGSVPNAQKALGTLRGLDEEAFKIYAERSKMGLEEISNIAHLDRYFSAEEALEVGLIDTILK